MSECESYIDDLKALADGELTPARRVALRLHLARCADCRRELDEMDNITASLKADEPNGFDAALRGKLLSHAPESAPAAPKPNPWRTNRKLQIWAAASMLAIVWFAGAAILPMFPQARKSLFSPEADIMESANRTDAKQAMSMRPGSAGSTQAPSKDTSIKAEREFAPMVGGASTSPDAFGKAYAGPMDADAAKAKVAQDQEDEMQVRQKQMKAMLDMSKRKTGSSGAVAGLTGEFRDGHAKDLGGLERHVVRTADITVEVQKLEEKSDSVERMVKDAGGFVASNQLSTGEENAKTAAMTLKVPTPKFDAVLAGIAKLGEVKAKNVTGEDITEKVSDETAAEKVLASEIRAKEQARDSASTLELKTRIEQVRGRLELMRKQSSLATMTVNLREKPKTAIKSGGFVDEMGDTGRSAVNSFLQAARLPILLLIWVLAYAPVWIPLVVAYRYAAGVNKKRVEAKQTRDWQEKRAAGTA